MSKASDAWKERNKEAYRLSRNLGISIHEARERLLNVKTAEHKPLQYKDLVRYQPQDKAS